MAMLADDPTPVTAVTASPVPERGVTATATVTAGAVGAGGFTTCPAGRTSAPVATHGGGLRRPPR
ncbi:hypothetical protein [Mycobacterium sp.]|uniref:hypothetical protein n=1 Tax=Mycobacterium sp. TaxID=1785 RepID=UPI0025D0345A|nr:hypothetical protein [Mycobacterium sp.]